MEIKITVTVGDNDPIEVKVDVPEKGECTVKRILIDHDIYTVKFCEDCAGWTNNAEMNKIFLIQQQEFCNAKLKQKGHLFLNEVYDCLGIPRTAYGQVVGWYYNEHNPIGDNYVDFGLFEDQNSNFINGFDKEAILNFNVDGNIFEYL